MNFNGEKTKALEERCLNFLNSMGFQVERNNDTKITDIDMKTHDGKYVDFQYSADFNVYGTLRIDFVSSFKPKSNMKPWAMEETIKNEFLLKGKDFGDLCDIMKQHIEVKKLGKIFDAKLSSIIYFLYSKPENEILETDIPTAIVIVKKEMLIDFILENIKPIVERRNVKINIKQNGDTWGSSFISIPLSALNATKDAYIIHTRDIRNSL
ncbi:hypothetical protein [Burkholderia cepacia]|uniref:hypothetical protein n=1 Tax=Burkholderia cepacia TaxID=292 RepID=UPI00158BC4E4|nr:hypothetical protein [Burkholderia cepacia]